MRLFHYTCDDGRAGIGDVGFLRSSAQLSGRTDLPDIARWIWLTDMETPDRNALGLTSQILGCDRMTHRYEVRWDYAADAAAPWTQVRRLAPAVERQALESAPGAKPRHWFVTRQPIEVVYVGLVAEQVVA